MAFYRKRGHVWYYTFVDSDGVKRERKGCTDRRATEDLARAAESEAARIRVGLVDRLCVRHVIKHINESLRNEQDL